MKAALLLLGMQYQCQTPEPDKPEAHDQNISETCTDALNADGEIFSEGDEGAGGDLEQKEKPNRNASRIGIPGSGEMKTRSGQQAAGDTASRTRDSEHALKQAEVWNGGYPNTCP